MEYSPGFIADFASRTLRNLDRIQQAEQDGENNVFPITQLWNSLLGLIVMPRERDERLIPETPISDLRTEGWPLPVEAVGDSDTLRDLVRHLRNAVAHGNVRFTADEDRQIVSLTLWNMPLRRGKGSVPKPNWESVIAASDLEVLARMIAGTYAEVFAGV